MSGASGTMGAIRSVLIRIVGGSPGSQQPGVDPTARDRPWVPEHHDRLLGFLRHADVHLDRGNLGAVREALDDARRLLGDEVRR